MSKIGSVLATTYAVYILALIAGALYLMSLMTPSSPEFFPDIPAYTEGEVELSEYMIGTSGTNPTYRERLGLPMDCVDGEIYSATDNVLFVCESSLYYYVEDE